MISCQICKWEGHYLHDHIREEHGLTEEEYLREHPGPLVSGAMSELVYAKNIRRNPLTQTSELTIRFGGYDIPINFEVPESACLVMPKHYRVPQFGKLAQDIREATLALLKGRSLYIWGIAGSGKDALVHAYSALTRTPGFLFSVRPGTDIQSWFFTRAFSKEGTFWEEGLLLRALRDGYTDSKGGVHPALVLISDIDRADRSQMEAMRLILDSIQGRIVGPNGETYKVREGTKIVVTANSSGSGDFRGQYISSNPIDASILDRFERAFEFHWMEWEDEAEILKEKFPQLKEESEVLEVVSKVSSNIRQAIQNETLAADFSHRSLCAWLGHTCDILDVEPNHNVMEALKRATRCWLDKMPDPETRISAAKHIDPHIPGSFLHSENFYG